MADRVHPAMHDMQATSLEPPAHGAARDAEAFQLGPADEAVLTLGEGGDVAVPGSSSNFGTHTVLNLELDRHGSILPWKPPRITAQTSQITHRIGPNLARPGSSPSMTASGRPSARDEPVPGAELTVIDGAGHFVVEDAAELVTFLG